MSAAEQLRAIYDAQLRTEAETWDAVTVHRIGSVWLATLAGGRGFVTYPRPDRDEAEALPPRRDRSPCPVGPGSRQDLHPE